MFDRFTDRARKVFGYARQESDRLHHDRLGTVHILLGLLKAGKGVAANVLENLGVDLDKARTEAEKLAGHGNADDSMQKPFSDGAREVLDRSPEEARHMGHTYVGTEHLLLGLLGVEDCEAAEVLTALGVEPEAVRKEVLELVGADPVIQKFTFPASGEISLEEMAASVEGWRGQAEAAGDAPLAAKLRYLLDYLNERRARGEDGPD